MPTDRRRLQISLTPETDKILNEFKELSGIASSSFISQYLHDSIPHFESLIQRIKESKKSPNEAFEIFNDAINNSGSKKPVNRLRKDRLNGFDD